MALDDDDKQWVSIGIADIELGRALRWTIYNGDRQLLLSKGSVINTVAEAESAFARGAYCLASEMFQADRVKGSGVMMPERNAKPATAANAPGAPRTLGFDASRIRVGDPIQLQNSPDSPRYVVRLIGYLKNRGLIVTQPEVHGELVLLRDGQPFVGRFFSGQNAFAFPTSVNRQTSQPFPHIHLAYPKEISVVEVRRSPRVDVALIAAVELDDGSQHPAKITNLSVSGAGLRSRHQLGQKGDRLGVKFKACVEGFDTYLVLKGEICNVTEQDDDPALPYVYGLRFQTTDHAMHVGLAAFVYANLFKL